MKHVIVGFLFLALCTQIQAEWLRLQSKNFTVLTDGSERAARNWAIEFEQFLVGLDGLFLHHGKTARPPLTIVLFAKKLDFQGYAPLRDGVVQNVAGYFSRLPDRGVVALSLEGENREVRRIVFHEGVHWYFSKLGGYHPPWFEEGIAEVFSSFEAKRLEYVIGRAIGEHIYFLRQGIQPKIEDVLKTTRDSINYNESARVGNFYALSWAFTHYLFFGKTSPGISSLLHYLQLVADGRQLEVAFKDAFGTDWEGMDKKLSDYLVSGNYGMIKRKFDPDSIEKSIVKSIPAGAEVDLALGYLAFVAKRTDQARKAFDRVLKAEPSKPSTYEALGMVDLLGNDYEGAASHFARAVELGSRNFMCYYAPAVTRVAGWHLAAIKTEDIPPADARSVARDLQRSLNLEPDNESAYAGLAELLGVAGTLTVEDRKFLELGEVLYPRNADIQVGLAVYDQRLGNSARALSILEALFKTQIPMSEGTYWRGQEILKFARIGVRKAEINQLVDKGEYDRALVRVGEALANQPIFPEMVWLQAAEQKIQGRLKLAEAEGKVARGDFEAAEQLVKDVQTADVEGANTAAARQLLEKIVLRRK